MALCGHLKYILKTKHKQTVKGPQEIYLSLGCDASKQQDLSASGKDTWGPAASESAVRLNAHTPRHPHHLAVWLLTCLLIAAACSCFTCDWACRAALFSSSPEAADSSSFDVQLGDIILTASDGLFDNMPDYMILQELKKLKVSYVDVGLFMLLHILYLVTKWTYVKRNVYFSPF